MSNQRLNPVAWQEGMFLRPQHFQHQELFFAEALRYHVHRLDPFHWGVRELSIDEDALAGKTIEIRSLEVVLRDGAIIRHGDNTEIPPRKIEDAPERLEVFLGLRRLSEAKSNIAERRSASVTARHLVDDAMLPDWNQDDVSNEIGVLFPNARLLLTGEERELQFYETIKIAEVETTDDPKRPYQLRKAYVPPLLTVQASPELSSQIMKTVNAIAAGVRTAAGQTDTWNVGGIPVYFALYTLARMTPVLRHLLSSTETRPFDLFTALVEVAGAVGAMNRPEAIDPPLYEHEDLYTTFHDILEFIDTELKGIVPVNFKSVEMPFDATRRCYVTSELEEKSVDPRNRYYLAVKDASLEVAKLTELVENGKLASRGGIRFVVDKALPGIAIEHLAGAPSDVESLPGYEYFRVEPHGAEWSRVREQYTLAAHLAGLDERASVRLLVSFEANPAPEAP